MKRLLLASVILSITTLAVAQELPFLRPDKEYSGVRVLDTPRGEMRQRIHWTPDRIRTVTEVEGMQMIHIVREDLGVIWMESPMMGGCLEQPLSQTEDMLGFEQAEGYDNEHVEYRKLGKETVGGHDTTKYEVTSKEPGETSHTALFWVTEDNIIVRMEVSGDDAAPDERFNMRLEELKIGPQPAELFESTGQCMSMPAMPGMPSMPGGPPGQN